MSHLVIFGFWIKCFKSLVRNLLTRKQGRNWRFVKGGGAMKTTEEGGLGGPRPPRNCFKIGPLNDEFLGHPKAKY